MLIDALVKDALALLEVLAGWDLDGPAAEVVALLALIAGQDVEPADDSDGTDGRWRIRRGVAKDRVISVIDPDARHAHKTVERRQDGFKAHLAVEPDTGIVTGCELTKATGAEAADGATGIRLLGADDTITDEHRTGEPIQVLGDSATAPATHSPRSLVPGMCRWSNRGDSCRQFRVGSRWMTSSSIPTQGR